MPKYTVGQMVDFFPSNRAVPASIQPYRIVRILPNERSEQLYRIKTATEAYERIARESELSQAVPVV